MSAFLIHSIIATMVATVATDPIIVVGGGLAGLSATIEIVQRGRSVILVEGEANTGGNSAKASSGINGAGTETQKAMGLVDSPENLIRDTLSAGDRENDEALVKILAEQSADAVEFLKKLEVDLSDVNLCGGHSVARTHWIPSPKEGRPIPAGFEIMKRLRARLNKYLEEKPELIILMENTKMVGILEEESKVVGISIETKEGHKEALRGSAVILATGGFSADRSIDGLLETYGREKLSFPSTNGAFARGDGVKLATKVGAKLVLMDRIQIHPTAFVDPKDPGAATKFLAAEALRGKGAILINSAGKRFGNELGRRDYLTGKINKDCSPISKDFQGGSATRNAAIMLMNEKHIEAFGKPAFNFYAVVKKFFVKYENVEELAKALGVDVEVLKLTFDEYKSHFESKKEDIFEKTVFPVAPIENNEPIYAAIVVPAIHYTMGGVKIDGSARVLNEQDKPIQGLFAAGEVTGGVHGSNRLAGNSLLECVVFGRIAGQKSAHLVEKKSEL